MPLWFEELSAGSLEEVLALQSVVRTRQKELRAGSSELVRRRLAKVISHDEYLAMRALSTAEAAECSRRASKLVAEIIGRQTYALAR